MPINPTTRLLAGTLVIAVLVTTVAAGPGAATRSGHPEQPTPAQSNSDAARKAKALIERLGDEDYFERETAQNALEVLGEDALGPLRLATRSPDPEVARRAHDALARIGHRLRAEKALAPTMVELDANRCELSQVLDELSRQSKYEVTLAALRVGEPDPRRAEVTIRTGAVPFFEAVLRVCAEADLEITSVGGVQAPSGPLSPSAAGARTIVLTPRGRTPKRPAAVYGAVLVEALTLPRNALADGTVSTTLHVWTEPKISWQGVTGVSTRAAVDDRGQTLSRTTRAEMPRSPDPTGPNVRQAELNLKPGARPASALRELVGLIHGTVRTGTEILLGFTNMTPGTTYESRHGAGASLQATLVKAENGQWRVRVHGPRA